MTEVTPVMVMDRMLEILAKPEAWTKGAYALNAADGAVDCRDPSACKFCVAGARDRAIWIIGKPTKPLYTTMAEIAQTDHGHDTSASFNDAPGTTHADILDYLKAVRARLEATCTA